MVCNHALIIHAVGRTFLRPREDVRRVGERFCRGSGPIADLSPPPRVAQGVMLPLGRKNAGAEALIMRSCSLTASYHVVLWKNDIAGFNEWKLYETKQKFSFFPSAEDVIIYIHALLSILI